MSVLWLNFAVVVFVQLLLFLTHAYYENKLVAAPRILLLGALSGIVPGPLTDLIFGKYLGLASYSLGFGPFFLILNAILLYGLFAANTLLMQKARFLHFCIWTVVVTAAFEITNLFFRVYTYGFAVPSVEYWIVAFVGPEVFAICIAMAWQVLFGYRFAFIGDVIKK